MMLRTKVIATGSALADLIPDRLSEFLLICFAVAGVLTLIRLLGWYNWSWFWTTSPAWLPVFLLGCLFSLSVIAAWCDEQG